MTDTITITGVRVGPAEANILAMYGAQDDYSADTIAAKLGEDSAHVLRLLGNLPGGGRATAARLAVTWLTRVGWPLPDQTPTEPAEPADGISAVVSRALETDRPSMVAEANRIADLADALQRRLDEHDKAAAIRAELDRIEARAAELRAQLPPEPEPRRRAAPLPASVDPRQVRQWAAANGVTCPAMGRIPATVLTAYQQATTSTARRPAIGEPA